MAAGADINLPEALLEPIGEDAPAGEDLRLDVSAQSLYFRLRDARAEARAAERQADNDPATATMPLSQWATVYDLATEALTTRTKDIEIACWLMESLTRRDGLTGFIDGAQALAGLIARYWQHGLFPMPDEQDPEGRLIAITGMSGQDRDGSLLQPLRQLVLFSRLDGTSVTVWEYERSRELAALGDQADRAARAAAASVPFVELEAEVRAHGRDVMAALRDRVAQALAAWRTLEAAIAAVTGGDAAPTTTRVRTLLETLNRLADRYAPPLAPGAIDGPAEPLAAASIRMTAGTTPTTRDGMLDEILRISAAFRATEPNSPLSFTLDEAVRRARLSWPDLLRELMPDLATRSAILSGAGLRQPEE